MSKLKQYLFALKNYRLSSILFNMFSIRTSNFVVVSFQKCGKTWLRMMLAKALSLKYSIPEIKLDLQRMGWFRKGVPKILISHAGSTLDSNKVDFPKLFRKKKIILLVRDPRDIVVSLFHSARTREKIFHENNISKFIRDENTGFAKIITFMNLWINETRKRKDDFLMLRYEDMKKDAANELRRIFSFMHIDMPDNIIQEAVTYGSFENMRKMETAGAINDYRMKSGDKNDPNSFRTRKGKVGSHREELSKEDIDYINKEMRAKLDKEYGYS